MPAERRQRESTLPESERRWRIAPLEEWQTSLLAQMNWSGCSGERLEWRQELLRCRGRSLSLFAGYARCDRVAECNLVCEVQTTDRRTIRNTIPMCRPCAEERLARERGAA